MVTREQNYVLSEWDSKHYTLTIMLYILSILKLDKIEIKKYLKV